MILLTDKMTEQRYSGIFDNEEVNSKFLGSYVNLYQFFDLIEKKYENSLENAEVTINLR